MVRANSLQSSANGSTSFWRTLSECDIKEANLKKTKGFGRFFNEDLYTRVRRAEGVIPRCFGESAQPCLIPLVDWEGHHTRQCAFHIVTLWKDAIIRSFFIFPWKEILIQLKAYLSYGSTDLSISEPPLTSHSFKFMPHPDLL